MVVLTELVNTIIKPDNPPERPGNDGSAQKHDVPTATSLGR